MPFRLGPLELILVLVMVFTVFGAGKLPQIGGAIGKGIRAFHKAQSGEDAPAKPADTKPQVQD